MNNEVWKHFAEHEVSHSMAHYLTTIHELRADQGYARVSDVAKELDVTKGSASVQVKHLKEKGLVAEDDNRHLQLTAAGDEVARQVIHTRHVLIRFFSELLGVEASVAESDACKIEHLLSEQTGRVMTAFVRFLGSDAKAAVGFRRALREYEPECPNIEDCEICEDVCMLDKGDDQQAKAAHSGRG